MDSHPGFVQDILNLWTISITNSIISYSLELLSAHSTPLVTVLAGCGTAIITAAYTNHWKPQQPPPPILEPEDVVRKCATMAVEMLHETIEKEVTKRQAGPTLPTADAGAMPGAAEPKFEADRSPCDRVFETVMDGVRFHCWVDGLADSVSIG